MKIKLDENLPVRLVARLSAYGYDVHTVPEERLSGCTDTEIWQAAQQEGRFLITQDLDFSDTRQFAPGTHAGLLLLRLRDPSARALTAAIETIAVEIGAWGNTDLFHSWPNPLLQPIDFVGAASAAIQRHAIYSAFPWSGCFVVITDNKIRIKRP